MVSCVDRARERMLLHIHVETTLCIAHGEYISWGKEREGRERERESTCTHTEKERKKESQRVVRVCVNAFFASVVLYVENRDGHAPLYPARMRCILVSVKVVVYWGNGCVHDAWLAS